MYKAELLTKMVEDNRLSLKDNEKALKSIMKIIGEALQNDEKVQLVGFGTYETRQRAERKGKNPRTGEEIIIPASKVPVFKPGKELKSTVNNIKGQG